MAKIKISKKELRQDELRTYGHQFFDWINQNKTMLTIVVAVLFVVIAGMKLYRYRENNITNQANFLYKVVLDSYFKGITTTEADKQEERKKLFEETVKKADSLINTFPNHPLAYNALIIKGTVLYYQNNFDESATIFQKALSTSKNNYAKAQAMLGLGYSNENKHFYTNDINALNQADESYTKAIELGKGSELAIEAMMCKARILEQKKQEDEAIKLYEKVIADAKDIKLPKEENRFKVGSWQYGLYQRYNTYNEVFSFSKDAEFAIDRLKGSGS